MKTLITTIAAVVLVGCDALSLLGGGRSSGGFWGMTIPAKSEPFPTATIVVCALIAGLVVCRAGHTILKRGDGARISRSG